MSPLGLTVQQLSRELHVPADQLAAVIAGKRQVTAELALRLGRYFGVTPERWLALQAEHELDVARREVGKTIDELVIPLEAA